MSENCMANCMASKIHLQLRNKIFYYRVELPRVNNKRRYKIISLHTQNYFEAQEKIKLTKAKQPRNNLIPTIRLHKLRMKCKNSAMTFLNRLLRNGKPSWQRSKKLHFLRTFSTINRNNTKNQQL